MRRSFSVSPLSPLALRPSLPLLSYGLAAAALVAAAALTACTSSTDSGTIQILTVDDPFVGPPAATEITVTGIDADGGTTTLAQGSASAGTIDLGTYDETDTDAVLVTATDSAGTRVAWGESLPVQLGAIDSVTLGVFVQRTGTLSRMPSPFTDGRQAPLVQILGGRYVVVAGGSTASLQAQSQLYDLVSWAPLAAPPAFPFAPLSLAVADLQALVISATAADWYDLTESTATAATAPTGTPSWGDVAGGATVTSTDGTTSYVVGGTRATGAPTSAVLVVTSSGTLSWATLAAPRLGAGAAWVDGLGLVVSGGNAAATTTPASSQPPGVELLSAGSTTSIGLGYAADTSTGEGLTALDGSHVLIVGGSGASGTAARVLSVPCTTASACSPTPWTVPLPTALPLAQAFSIDTATAFVVGEDATGAMHAYKLSATASVEIPFRVARQHARAIRLPTGAAGAGPIAVVGGDTTMESFTP